MARNLIKEEIINIIIIIIIIIIDIMTLCISLYIKYIFIESLNKETKRGQHETLSNLQIDF